MHGILCHFQSRASYASGITAYQAQKAWIFDKEIDSFGVQPIFETSATSMTLFSFNVWILQIHSF
jgi:hypothetical protein